MSLFLFEKKGNLVEKFDNLLPDEVRSSFKRGKLLRAELEKPVAAIDIPKCLKLLDRVDLNYKNWRCEVMGDSLLEDMAEAIRGKRGATPADPACFILACEKGLLSIAEKIIEKKIVHPGQWNRQTGETGKIAAAKSGHLDIIILIDETIKKYGGSHARIETKEFEKFSASHRESILLSSARAFAEEYSNEPDYMKKSAYQHAKENGHVHIIAYMLDKNFEDYLYHTDYRPSDAGYAQECQRHKEHVAAEQAEALSLSEKKQTCFSLSPKIPKN